MELKCFYGKTKMKQLHHQIQSMIIIISYSSKKKKKKIKDKYQNQTTNNQLESETLTWHEDMQCECWECMRVRGGVREERID